ncbi:MAG: ribosome-associated heat shock protein Hsp15 [Candidatus Marivariicella framensis]|jgi:ribosome-associated heat shock protein Hsp15|tara:strand:- start:1179 stop:1550 length:372 start_codon:yes stop_codon:yes gene_type:complete
MRIDQLLWYLRYYKSRSLATNACKKGHVRLKNQILKPSRDILPLDLVLVRKDQINYEFKVLDIPKSRVGAKIVDIYRQDLTKKNAFENKESQGLNKIINRSRGLGRPTKKDRREIDEFKKDDK